MTSPTLPVGVDPALFPFRSAWREERGLRQHYVDEGPRDAPAVLMVHGNPTWSFYFRSLINELRGTHRVVAPDHIGCGLSDKPGDHAYAYTLEQRVRDLDAVVTHAGLERPLTLVVHDWGGFIGLAWAVEHVERIERLVVLNTAAFPLLHGGALPLVLSLARAPVLGPLAVRGLNAFALGASWLGSARALDPKVRRALVAPYDSWSNRIATLRFVEDIPRAPGEPGYDVLERTGQNLARLAQKPMLLCWGMRDFVFDQTYLAEWVSRFPNAQVHRFADAGHYVLEDAAEPITRLVRQFVDAPGGVAA